MKGVVADKITALGSWADEMEDVPVASESRTGYGNDRRVFTQPSYPERSFGTYIPFQASLTV